MTCVTCIWEILNAGQRVSKILLAERYLLYMYRTYVNQMNLNGKLRKNWGAKQGAKQQSGRHMTHPGPPYNRHWLSCFRAGKLLVASCLLCVNCRLNPHHKPCALTLRPKQVFPNLWHMYLRGAFAGVHSLRSCNKLTIRHKNGICLAL